MNTGRTAVVALEPQSVNWGAVRHTTDLRVDGYLRIFAFTRE